MNNTNPDVDFYFNKTNKWQQEIKVLRLLLLDCGLTETLKWGCPCYAYNARNIVLIHVFKDYCALLFFKGALLSNNDGLLIQQTKNVQAARQLRFEDMATINKQKLVIKAYIFEAIEVEKAGLKVALKPTADYQIPIEFEQKLDADAALKTAFDLLTPGRKRAYLLYFAAAKQSKTRISRVEKCIPLMLQGKGLND